MPPPRQAESFLTSSQLLLAKNEYIQAADAVASADELLGDLQQAEAGSATRRGSGVDKENRRSTASGGAGKTCVVRASKSTQGFKRLRAQGSVCRF